MIYDVIANNNLDLVARIEYGSGYSWADMAVYYSASEGMFFWLSDEGCSCNGLGDDVKTLSELENGDRRAALEAVGRFSTEYNSESWHEAANVATALDQIRDYKK
jgi:hypothetical protein